MTALKVKVGKEGMKYPSGCVPSHEVHRPPVYTGVTLCYSVLLLWLHLSPCSPSLFLGSPKTDQNRTVGSQALSISQGWGLACNGVLYVRLTGVVFLWVTGHIKQAPATP